MDQLIPVLMVVAIVAVMLSKQIGKVTQSIDLSLGKNSHEHYAHFSAIIQEHVREIKLHLDSTKEVENRIYKFLPDVKEDEVIEQLSDYIRKLVFFETMMAKQKSAKEIEAELFEILNGLELFLKNYCVDGEALSGELREKLLEAYSKL